MMGISLGAQGLMILTDVQAVATDFGSPGEKWIRRATPAKLHELMSHFPDGSMGPKVESAIEFVTRTGGWSVIGSLKEADRVIRGEAGTLVTSAGRDGEYIDFYASEESEQYA